MPPQFDIFMWIVLQNNEQSMNKIKKTIKSIIFLKSLRIHAKILENIVGLNTPFYTGGFPLKVFQFIKTHPLLCVIYALGFLCLFGVIPFNYLLIIIPVLLLILYLIKLPTTLGYTAFLLESLTKKRNKVIPLYRYAYKHKTKCGQALMSYGLYLIETFQFETAVDVFQTLLSLPKLDAMVKKFAQQDLSIAFWKSGDLPGALAIMENMLKEYEFFNLAFYTTLGFYYAEIGDYDNAFKYTNLALEQDDSHGPAYDNLGQIYYRMGDYEEAEAMFHKALELKPGMVDSAFYLGLLAEKQGDDEAARTFFQAAARYKINGMNTVSPEQVKEKAAKYS